MAIELGTVILEHLTSIQVRERARVVRHPVPGMAGDHTQHLGRASVEVDFSGIFYGAEVGGELQKLRDAYLKGTPLDFFAEAKGEGYFAQVLITHLDVFQRAGHLQEFLYTGTVTEYVKPPSAAGVGALAALDTSIAADAAAFMDGVQNGLASVAAFANLAANFSDPTPPLKQMPGVLQGALGDGPALFNEIRDLFGEPPDTES